MKANIEKRHPQGILVVHRSEPAMLLRHEAEPQQRDAGRGVRPDANDAKRFIDSAADHCKKYIGDKKRRGNFDDEQQKQALAVLDLVIADASKKSEELPL